mmetsp:Transcript_8102/g.15879  ORF Transcript_8102/g.15879 Transcript_8102/m.15879 type:complete len:119 (-) Transcript_8102:69-425(-)
MSLRAFMGGALAASGALVVATQRLMPVAECISIDKQISMELNKIKQRKKRLQDPCTGLMLGLLACYKTYDYARGKCDSEERVLMECVQKEDDNRKKVRAKDSIKFHIARLMRLRVRRI